MSWEHLKTYTNSFNQKGRTRGMKKEQKKVNFELLAPEAKQVSLTGDFNNWGEGAVAMKKDKEGVWKTNQTLSPGRYEYKFIVDDEWWTDPQNSDTAYNDFGEQNSVKEVAA